MVFQKFKGINDLETKILVPITGSSNTVILDTGEGLKWGSVFPIKGCFISFDSQNRIVKKEVINVTGRTDDILSITRAVEKCKTSYNATTLENIAFSFDNGDYLFNFISAGVFDDIQDEIMNKQATLISGTNIRRINGSSILGSGDLSVSGTWGSIGGTLTNQTDLSNALNGKQANLISGTNIRTINDIPILGSGNINVKVFGGNGTLGNVTILGNTTIDVGYTVHSCYEYSDLSINFGATLDFTNCNGKIVWIKVKGTLTNNGTISNNGTNTGGASSFLSSYNNAGNGTTPGVARTNFNLNDHSIFNVLQGGKGGNSVSTNPLRLGGNGGGVIIIEANSIVNNGTISCNGANGSSYASPDFTGAGGGGAGGQIYLIYNSISGNGTYSVIGGNGGSGSSGAYSGGGGGGYGAGGNAGAGSNGLNYYSDSVAPPGTKNTNGGSVGPGGGGGGGGGFIYFKKNNGLII